MDLFEYQGKQYFARFGIPISKGGVADTVEEALAQAEAAGYPVVVKAQVKVGGRGKAGGVKLAGNAEEVRTHAGNILGLDIKGHVVKRLWIEHASDIAREYYASFTLDRSAKKHLGMLSAEGGVEIEEVAVTHPDAIATIHVDPVDGLSAEVARQWVDQAGLDLEARDQAAQLLVKLYDCYTQGDCDLAEINPLILTPEGRVHALDAKVTLDDNASFRHPEWEEFAGDEDADERETRAKERGLNYIGLDGSVGIIANGAGLAMSTLDVVNQCGGLGRQLPRHRRRGQRRRHGGGARGDQFRFGGPVDLRQHLRRDHPGRRGGERGPRGPQAGRHLIADRAPPRRHQCCRRAGDPRPTPVRPVGRRAHHARCRPSGGRTGRERLMSIFVDEQTKVVIQGLSPTSQGLYHGLRNRAYGTQVVAGTNPKRGGEEIEGIPVFATVAEAVGATGATASFISVPPKFAADAIIEAAAAGLPFVVCITEGIPAQDEAIVYNRLVREFPGTRLLGPNCPGIISPGKCNIGITSGDIAMPGGPVGIVSRSGTLTYQALHELSQQGVGQTTCVGIGGDPVPGTSFIDCLAAFEADPDTRAIMMIGEIGGSAEEEAAEYIASSVTKPVVCYVAGVTAPPGRKMGHAGAIISGSKGTAQAKMEALSEAGATVALNPTEAGEAMVAVVRKLD